MEDDDIDAMSIERSFRKKHILNPIVRAYDGMEALALLRENQVPQPLVILLDLQMPRMGGIEFLKTIRADKKLTKLVVFVLTTSESEQDMLVCSNQKISGYFIKGEVGQKLLEIITPLMK